MLQKWKYCREFQLSHSSSPSLSFPSVACLPERCSSHLLWELFILTHRQQLTSISECKRHDHFKRLNNLTVKCQSLIIVPIIQCAQLQLFIRLPESLTLWNCGRLVPFRCLWRLYIYTSSEEVVTFHLGNPVRAKTKMTALHLSAIEAFRSISNNIISSALINNHFIYFDSLWSKGERSNVHL